MPRWWWAAWPVVVTTHVFAGLPLLSPAEQDVLVSVQDASDVPDAAFAVMSEHVTATEQVQSNEPIRLQVFVEDLLADPSASRGDLYRVEGQFLQRRNMPPPYQEIEEWFLRLPSGDPVAVYLPVEDAQAMDVEGQSISIDARFYKVLQAVARDQQLHRYPAFFGRSPQLLSKNSSAAVERMDILVLLGFLVLLVIIGLVVMAFARRQKRVLPRWSPGPVEPRANITDDPAVALRELRAKAERNQN